MNLSYSLKKKTNNLLSRFGVRLVRTADWRQEQERKAFISSAVARDRILTLARLLTPQKPVGVGKIRLGSSNDGGYVCLNDFNGVDDAFSLGIERNDDWDIAAAEKGLSVHQFDYTVDAAPHAHPRCHFRKSKIVPKKSTQNEEDLSTLFSYASGHGAPILKIDIEGDEWPIFAETSTDVLRKFSQIIVEFHAFSKMVADPWYPQALSALQKLHADFAVVHVHANNCGGWVPIGNIPFPGLLEVTYANRSRYAFALNEDTFPTSCDAPNIPELCEMPLGRFVF